MGPSIVAQLAYTFAVCQERLQYILETISADLQPYSEHYSGEKICEKYKQTTGLNV
jgi:hypothetical protein